MADGTIKFNQRTTEPTDLSSGETSLYTKTDGNVYKKAYGGDEILIPAGGVWQDWTPVWTASTTNPSIGNGTLVGKNCVIGNTVHLIIGLVCGSTTTFGSGGWSFSLPFPVKAQTNINQTFIGQVIARDASPAGNYLFFCRVTRYATVINAFFNVSSSSTIITGTSPLTWAESDQLFLQLTYEK